MKRIARIAAIILALLALYLLAWPVPIDPVAWEPPPSVGLTGPFAPNDALAAIERLVEVGPGPEDMARGPDGLIYTGLQDGRIVRFDPNSGAPAETFVNTGGRPLGMDFGGDGRLYVADAFKGLLAIEPSGAITVLTDVVDGERMMFVNDLGLDVAGKIFFTDSSRRFDQEHYMLDFIEGRRTGRLLSYDLQSGETEVYLDGLGFANGVAVGDRGGQVWVAETLGARITQMPASNTPGALATERPTFGAPGAHTTERPAVDAIAQSAGTLIEHLPGYPDNISFNDSSSTIWVALPAVRPNPVEALAGRPFLRKMLARIPGLNSLKIDPYSMVIGIDPEGRVVANLQDSGGGYPTITSVKEIDGYLYFGSIEATALGRMPVPASVRDLVSPRAGDHGYRSGVSADIPPTAVVPTPEQLAYQEMELIGFVHFTVNTFTDREWGYGDETPTVFAPTALDADQWTRIAAEVGMGELILTAKHHDGFALWPSHYTEHSVKNSSWRDGNGDVVAELVEAAHRHGLKVGLYLSPWDRNHAAYGTPAYIDDYRNQLTELLTDYGDITEVWFDGANGGDGYYGGANEERRIDRATYYDWPATWALVKSLRPGALIFSDAGPDIRWTGNENGFAGETNWSTIDAEGIVVGAADSAYLNHGDPDGAQWVVPLCNTSIRPGWFYHEAENDRLKSPQELVDVYYRSVGRNCVLLLNVPPDTRGLWHETDVAVLREFRRILDETFATDLAAGKPVSIVGDDDDTRFAPANIVDGDAETYWATDGGGATATLEIDLGVPARFDRILLQEPIRFGQRISGFAIEARVEGRWREVARATTVGYKRLLRIDPVTADRVRLVIEEAVASPLALSALGLFEASPAESGG